MWCTMAIAGASLLFVQCAKDNPANPAWEDDAETWTFSGKVVDGSSGDAMDSVTVSWVNRLEEDTSTVTKTDGKFSISRNAPGQQTFSFSAGSSYSVVNQVVESQRDNDSILLDQSSEVTLYPLSGRLNGSVVARLHKLAEEVNVDSATVMIKYVDENGTAIAGMSPSGATALTTAGAFSFTSLAVGAQLEVKVSNVTISGVDYTLSENIDNLSLAKTSSIGLGKLVMKPVDAADFDLLLPPSDVVDANAAIHVRFSENVDTTVVEMTEQGGEAAAIAHTVTISGKTVTITPTTTLVEDANYNIKVYAFGVLGGEYNNANNAWTVTAKGGGLSNVVSSNVLDKNHQAVHGLGLGDTIEFTMSDSVTKANASVYFNEGTSNNPDWKLVLSSLTVDAATNKVMIAADGQWQSGEHKVEFSGELENGAPVNFDIRFSTEAALSFIYSNVYKPVTQNYGEAKVGLGLNDNIIVVANKTLESANAVLEESGGADVDISVSVRNDTVTINPDRALDAATDYNLYLTVTTASNESKTIYTNSGATGYVQFKTASTNIYVVSSNVITSDGKGLTGVAVDDTLWYLLSTSFDASTIDVDLETAGFVDVNAVVTTSGDTVFVDPVTNLSTDQDYQITIKGKSSDGDQINIALTASDEEFTTEKSLFVLETNTEDANGNDLTNFTPYDTMWVRYSEVLDSDIDHIEWGTGASVELNGDTTSNNYNAHAWINGDTLFVVPLSSLVQIPFGTSDVGFEVDVKSTSGKASGDITFEVDYKDSDLYVKATNAKDANGNMRTDLGMTDPIWVVSSVKLSEVTGVSGGSLGGTDPSDLTLDNVTLSATGDTITYTPSVKLDPGTHYDIDFDVERTDGITSGITGVLDVEWTTESGVRIVSVNNRSGGKYRAYKVIGDSLVVTFSKAVDTSGAAPTQFDVNNFVTNYTASWSSDLKTVTIKNTDTLVASLWGTATPYTSGAGTRQYNNVSFDLTTADGEQQAALDPANETIELHTEYGLYAVQTNFLENHTDLSDALLGTESETDTFPVNGDITITFNRAVDSSAIKNAAENTFIALLENGTTVKLDITLSFSSDAKTVTINPAAMLDSNTIYRVWVSGCPGAGIRYATNGTYTGPEGGSYLSDGFTTESAPDVSITGLYDLTVVADTMDTSATSGLGTNRMAASAEAYYNPWFVYPYDSRYLIGGMAVPTSLRFNITKPAWNKHHGDSVDAYQYQVRKVTRNGTTTGWYTGTQTKATTAWSNSWNATNPSQLEWDLDISLEAFYSNLLTSSKNGYTNFNHIFNDSSELQFRFRAVHDINADGDYEDPGEFGVWSSSSVVLRDNTAPMDSAFVDLTTTAERNDPGDGGVNIGFDDCYDSTGATVTHTINRTGANDFSIYYVYEVEFSEDMDTSTAPSVGAYSETSTNASGINVVTTGSDFGWTAGDTYTFAVVLTGGTDYTGDAPYLNVDISAMKDNSGVDVQESGNAPTAPADGVTRATVIGHVNFEYGSKYVEILGL